MRILDMACSVRSIWYQKNHKDVVFMDMRKGKFYAKDDTNTNMHTQEVYIVNPNIISLFSELPFKNDSFDHVVFDPPHLFIPKATMRKKYGTLTDSWREDISGGFKEGFRVLKCDGILVLKWNEGAIPVKDIIKLSPFPPLYGTRTGQSNKTHWIVFIKENMTTLEDFYETRE